MNPPLGSHAAVAVPCPHCNRSEDRLVSDVLAGRTVTCSHCGTVFKLNPSDLQAKT